MEAVVDRVSFVLAVCGGVSLGACSGDESTTDHGDPQPTSDAPYASIWSHEDGGLVIEGLPTTLGGTATDDGPVADLVGTWLVDGVQQCTGLFDAYENSTCMWSFPVGVASAQIRFEASDPGGATGGAEITLNAFVNQAPQLRIDEPTTPPWNSNVPVNFVGGAVDQGTTPGEMVVTWESSLDGPLVEVDGTLDPKSTFHGQALLSEGTHVLTASVTDPSDITTTAEVTITVGPPAP